MAGHIIVLKMMNRETTNGKSICLKPLLHSEVIGAHDTRAPSTGKTYTHN